MHRPGLGRLIAEATSRPLLFAGATRITEMTQRRHSGTTLRLQTETRPNFRPPRDPNLRPSRKYSSKREEESFSPVFRYFFNVLFCMSPLGRQQDGSTTAFSAATVAQGGLGDRRAGPRQDARQATSNCKGHGANTLREQHSRPHGKTDRDR